MIKILLILFIMGGILWYLYGIMKYIMSTMNIKQIKEDYDKKTIMKKTAILFIFLTSLSYAIDKCPTYSCEFYFTRTTERTALKTLLQNGTTDRIQDFRFMDRVSTDMPLNPKCSSFTATTQYLGFDVTYLKAKEARIDNLINTAKSNINNWVAQGRIVFVRIKKHYCSHASPPGQCEPCVETIIYER
jgi:hypothetical protein